MVQQCIDQSAIWRAGGRVHDHSRRFVHHDHIIIFKYNLKRDRLGQRFQLSRFIQLQIQHLPLIHAQRWVRDHNTV